MGRNVQETCLATQMKVNLGTAKATSEVCKQDGKPYPPKSIHHLLAGLQCYMLQKNSVVPKFLNSKDACFQSFLDTAGEKYLKRAMLVSSYESTCD